MSNLNNIFGNFSYQYFKSPLNFLDAINKLRTEKSNYTYHSDNQLIYGENVDYDHDYLDNSYKLDLNSNRISNTVIDIQTRTSIIGYNNDRRLFTGRGDDSIIGLGNATVNGDFRAIAKGESNTIDTASADSTAKAIFKATVEATGVSNSNALLTGRGNDTIVGFGDVQSAASAIAEATAADLSLATANSEATVEIDVLAIGVENVGYIAAGQGTDLVVGVANTSTQTQAQATSIANALDFNLSPDVIADLNQATAESNSVATANSLVSTLGIANSGSIFLNEGNDTIFGLANSESSSDALSNSQTASRANQIATATADAEANALTFDDTIGIVNQGLIATGAGHDSVIGFATNNQPTSVAEANAEANGETINTDANVNTLSVSDTSGAIAIGIDNSGGIIRTEYGSDRVIAYGSDVGITGGKINTGRDNDRVIGYAGRAGVNEAIVDLGRGNDYFQAAIANLDPITGAIVFTEDQTNSIRNSQIFGGAGNDTFKIGGFSGTVSINGGENFDTLKLYGDVDSYEFSVGSNNRSLTIEDSGSILTVNNVEAIYFGNNEQFSISDFA